MNNDLFLFTASFPYGKGEAFLENELIYLSKHFDEIFIFPYALASGQPRDLPKNVSIVLLDKKELSIQKPTFSAIISLYLKGYRKDLFNLNQLRYRLAYCKQLLIKKELLKIYLENEMKSEGIFYSFWFSEWATVLSLLKNDGKIDQFISRAHGFDIYEDRQAEGFIPFRKFQLDSVQRLYCASQFSMNYMHKHYPSMKNKISFSHLGVMDNGINPWKKSSQLTLVSCSNLIALKRVDLIAQLLLALELDIKWIHFGSGAELPILKEHILKFPKNIEVELKGDLANSAIIDFYKSTSVDAFIHMSESEGGVPVSIQEACSFSIPIIARNAGGVSEIVNDQTGLLLPFDFQLDKEINRIRTFLLNECGKSSYRSQIRGFFKNHFLAELNYSNFSKEIEDEHGKK